MSATAFDLAVQIVNYRTKSYLWRCLESVLADIDRERFSCVIKVLDNASGDDLSDIRAAYATAPVKVYVAEENRGFGAGHNELARRVPSDCRLLLILNPDTVLTEPHTVRRLIARLEKTSGVAVAGPMLVDSSGQPQVSDHGDLRGIRARLANAVGHSYWRPCTRVTEAAWVAGAAFLIARETFQRFGGFDEQFFLYKEEEDLCLRIRKAGGRVIYDPTISILHYGSVVASREDHLAASIAYFQRKHIETSTVRRALLQLFRLRNKVIHRRPST